MWLARGPHKLKARAPAGRRLLLETLFRLAWARIVIRLISFRRITALLGLMPGESYAVLTPAQSATAAQIGQAIRIAATRTPWRSACLEQALAGAAMLHRRNLPITLYLGVARDGMQSDGMAAHAWLRCGVTIVTGEDGHERFAIVGRFRWQ